MLKKEQVLAMLKKVADPEIPTVNIVEFGMVESITVTKDEVSIQLLPTFLGCPAIEMIKQNVVNELKKQIVDKKIDVTFILDRPWTSDRIHTSAIQHLKEYGIAPPPKSKNAKGDDVVECPYCGSPHTMVENLFGPTACRSIFYCKSCKNPFEAMKPMYLLDKEEKKKGTMRNDESSCII